MRHVAIACIYVVYANRENQAIACTEQQINTNYFQVCTKNANYSTYRMIIVTPAHLSRMCKHNIHALNARLTTAITIIPDFLTKEDGNKCTFLKFLSQYYNSYKFHYDASKANYSVPQSVC